MSFRSTHLILVIADRFSFQIGQLTQGDFGSLFWESRGASPYCEQQQHALQSLANNLWFLRLALEWENFPEQRAAVLRSCREQLQEATATFPEWLQNEPATVRSVLLPDSTQASELPRPEATLSAEEFITGVIALVKLTGICRWGSNGGERMTRYEGRASGSIRSWSQE